MASADSLVAIFEAITQNLERDQSSLNHLDRGNGNSGDNMVHNFQLVTSTLRKVTAQGGQQDVGAALGQAAQVLRDDGKGATAPIYASGFQDAATQLQGKSSFSLSDLMPLLQALLGGMQKANNSKPGEGSMLDAIVPGVMGYLDAKNNGQSEMEAILSGLLGSRRGANSTAGASTGYGQSAGRDTTGQIDPGAAGAASMLEGMFGALLQSAMRSQAQGQAQQQAPAQPAQPAQQPSTASTVIDILGSLFGGR
ncbi:dihydroxyacetone kinase subunit L [Oscillochloris sp. ZM17-4]|uniref:DAK2 domain-containing protein n=1 Tax=Oscillochloris sp. ZM17-4 TaxID=2866714 RepID=UPI001C732D1B|nr:DAK2 domain-containing protein [Oscillochloris sp. ZM17-4]MBX0329641.1 dihydroxyacetone kinase subunit L [Oscillochloris sp. ZM17-4]